MNIDELYKLAKNTGITTHTFPCPESKAISVKYGENKFIGIDPSVVKNEYDERLVLAHEIGHALTDAYYENYSNPINVLRIENRANKKVVELLVPKKQLDKMLHENTTVFDLAQHFCVPEEMIKKAVWLYYKKQLP
ncbi:MAG: ImmA/IrrE family metallo-endopeptidase [Clostridiales bacterium]|nr:ImmA/IrrE family metallo-endopeptidase [Clostridiales bacterium]